MSNPRPDEQDLLGTLKALYQDPADLTRALSALKSLGLCGTPSGFTGPEADLDLLRPQRCGFPEVIYGERKSTELILQLIRGQQAAGQSSLVTRIRPESAGVVAEQFPAAIVNAVANTVRVPAAKQETTGGPVYVVTAGSSDRSVAEEALETLRWMQVQSELIQDVGVAGPHRLLQHVDTLRKAAVVVCVAGMEAALPSVLGGYVPCPVIGVPTSVGYGASLGGLTAMLSMLTCCASNVVCVNIDAGFKGGYVAGLIASRMGKQQPDRGSGPRD